VVPGAVRSHVKTREEDPFGDGYAAQSGWPHRHSGSGVPDISISAHRSLQNLLFPRSTKTSSQRHPRWSHFNSFCGMAG